MMIDWLYIHTFPTFGIPTIAVCNPMDRVVVEYDRRLQRSDTAVDVRVKLDVTENPIDCRIRVATNNVDIIILILAFIFNYTQYMIVCEMININSVVGAPSIKLHLSTDRWKKSKNVTALNWIINEA